MTTRTIGALGTIDMLITRKFGKFFRGTATPFQIYIATILSALLAFVPVPVLAPGYFLVLLGLLIVLNANLLIAAFAGFISYLAAVLLLPVSFVVGQWLLHGPFSGLFATAVNAPVLSWFGWDYYALVGGIPFALLTGGLLGFAANSALRGFRRKMISLEAGENRYVAWSRKRWVKILDYVFIGPGSKGKKTWQELEAKKVGNPVRPLGLALVVVSAVFLFIVGRFLQEPILTPLLRDALTRVNGATVDLQAVRVDWRGGTLELVGLALTDRNDLQHNLIAAERVAGTVSLSSALRRTLVIDEMVLYGAEQGGRRTLAGSLSQPAARQREVPTVDIPDFDTIDRWVRDAAVWRERLRQAQDLMERFGGGAEAGAEPGAEQTLPLRVRLQQRAESLGYGSVRAEHLRRGNPTLTVQRIATEAMRNSWLPAETIDFELRHISSHPALLTERPVVALQSSGGTVLLDLLLGSAVAGVPHGVRMELNQISADAAAAQLRVQDRPLFQGGTLSLRANGTVSAVDSNLPIQAHFTDTTFFIGSASGTLIRNLILPIEVRGPVANPAVRLSDDALQRALRQAGQDRLLREVENRLPVPLPFGR